MAVPAVGMGVMFVGPMQLWYDASGATILQYSTGLKVAFLPSGSDPSLFVQAEAMGYGRQVGLLVRDRILMHCLLAEIEAGEEPLYLIQTGGQGVEGDRVNMLLCMLNQVRCDYKPCPNDHLALTMATHMVKGGAGGYVG